MTLSELKEVIDRNTQNGYGDFEISSYDCEGGGSYKIKISVDIESKEVNITG